MVLRQAGDIRHIVELLVTPYAVRVHRGKAVLIQKMHIARIGIGVNGVVGLLVLHMPAGASREHHRTARPAQGSQARQHVAFGLQAVHAVENAVTHDHVKAAFTLQAPADGVNVLVHLGHVEQTTGAQVELHAQNIDALPS